MNRAIVKSLLQRSHNEVDRFYRDGRVDQDDYKAFCFLWHRIQYRLSDTDKPDSWVSREFEKAYLITSSAEQAYWSCIRKINIIRAWWGFEPINITQGERS